MDRANWVAVNYSSSKLGKDSKKSVVDQFLVGWNMALTDAISATLQYGHKHDNKYSDDHDTTDNFFDLSFYAYF